MWYHCFEKVIFVHNIWPHSLDYCDSLRNGWIEKSQLCQKIKPLTTSVEKKVAQLM